MPIPETLQECVAVMTMHKDYIAGNPCAAARV